MIGGVLYYICSFILKPHVCCLTHTFILFVVLLYSFAHFVLSVAGVTMTTPRAQRALRRIKLKRKREQQHLKRSSKRVKIDTKVRLVRARCQHGVFINTLTAVSYAKTAHEGWGFVLVQNLASTSRIMTVCATN